MTCGFSEGSGCSNCQIMVFLKQAVREQRIPFEVAARPAVGHRAESLEEQNRLTASTAASSEPFHPLSG